MSWQSTVETVGKWYEGNIHNYNQGQYSNCPIPNCGKVRHDCSGFVSACLRAAGIFKSTQIHRSGDFLSNGSAANTLRQAGFVNMPYSTSTVQPFDIMAYDGHVEIFAGVQGKSWRSWSWGSCHDGQNGHVGMPAYTSAKNSYKSIWRMGGNGAAITGVSGNNWGAATPAGGGGWNGSSWGNMSAGGGAPDPTMNNYATYSLSVDAGVFTSAMNNSFTPSMYQTADSSTQKHTRIYSATNATLKVDQLSLPLGEATIETTTEGQEGNDSST